MNTEAAWSSASAPAWFKSSYSGAEGGDCVEVAPVPGAVLVRDSKRAAGPVVVIGPVAWADFVAMASDC
ncbi:DUF397 domain-containing protein [Streptomyces nigra]|uniref:DUF397 domain-containing protein n=1 Tax=Streptomyces nigra TaxID=1827580 RepID=UPI003638CA95